MQEQGSDVIFLGGSFGSFYQNKKTLNPEYPAVELSDGSTFYFASLHIISWIDICPCGNS
jgi:hypothetical protein